MRIITLLIAICVLIPTVSMGSEPITAANDFWKVFVKGDANSLESQYADEILLKAGSEFLKPEWGINKDGDRSKDKKVTKAELIKAYKSMLARLGQKRWQSIFGSIKKDKIRTKVLKNKHVLLTVKTGPGDDYIEFELALNKDQTRWLVVSEFTDY
jgi:hypothetical protein